MKKISFVSVAIVILLLSACGSRISGVNKEINDKINALFTDNKNQYSYVESEYGVEYRDVNNTTHIQSFNNQEMVKESINFYFYSNLDSDYLDTFVHIYEMDGMVRVFEADEWSYSEHTYSDLNTSDYINYFEDYPNQFDVFFDNDLEFESISDTEYQGTFKHGSIDELWIIDLFSEIYEDSTSINFSNIVITYSFKNDGLEFSLEQTFDSTNENIESGRIYYTATLSFPASVEVPQYDVEDYYLISSNDMDDAMQEFLFGTDQNISVFEGSNNYYRYYFTPGSYRFNAMTTEITDYTVYDSLNNEIAENEFFTITEAGYYFVQITARSDKKATLVVQGGETEDVCNEDISQCSSVVQLGEYDYITILNPTGAERISITLKSIDEFGLDFILDGVRNVIYLDETITFDTNGNTAITFMIGSLISGYTEFTEIAYTIEYEFSGELDSSNNNYNDMISTFINDPNSGENVDLSANFNLTESSNLAYLKFTVDQMGLYLLYIDILNDCYTIPQIDLYDSDGNLIQESFEEGEIEPGDYYFQISLVECDSAEGHLHLDLLE